MMRVLHFLPVYAPAWQFGGPVLSVSRLCEGLVQQEVQVRVITTNAGLPDFPRDQLGIPQNVKGVQVIYYEVDDQEGPIRSKALLESLLEHMNWADLLHLSSIWQPMGIPVQNAAHASAVPVIQTLRGALGPYSWRRGSWKKAPYFWLKERPLLQKVVAIHCTTNQEAREISWLGLKPAVHILPNPMQFSQLHYNPQLGEGWRTRLGIPSTDKLLLVVGRLHHKKGLDLLPVILSKCTHLSWRILFIGEDNDGTEIRLKNKMLRLGLAERCHWLQYLPADQLSGPYNAADCLLLPSRHENFGNVVVEALACGCGVLISDRVGVAESIEACPGVNICSRSKESWITSLQRVLASNRPGILATQWVENYFSQKIVAKQAKQIYASLITNG